MACRRNQLLISEEEIVYIKNLYGLLKEDQNNQTEITVDFEEKFPGGKYANLTEKGKTELQNKLNQTKEWLISNKGSLIVVQIEASESRIISTDKEQNPSPKVDLGYLSRRRAQTMKRELKEFFKTLVSEKVLPEMPIFEAPKILIGPTPVSETGQALPKYPISQYNNEQYTRVYLKLMAPAKCLTNINIEVMYNRVPDPSFKCRGGHTCDVARFDVLANGVSLGIADLNNGRDGGSRTSGKLVIDQAKAEQIVGQNNKKIKISLKCLSGSNCHSGTPEIKITKGNETLYHQCSPAMGRSDQREIQILTVDTCGNVVEKGTGDATNKDKNTKTETPAQPTGYTINVPSDYDLKDDNFIRSIAANQLIDSKGQPNNERFLTYGYNQTTGEWVGSPIGFKSGTGDFFVPETGLVYRRQGAKGVVNVDPGTRISKIVGKGKPNNNPPPGYTDVGLNYYDETSSGKYYVEKTENKDSFGQEIPELRPGKSPKKLEKEQAAGIVRFNLDDEAIEEFEKYFIDNKLVNKTSEGLYDVIATSITYGGKVFKKGTKLKLDS
jgi:hypothetical protein